MAAYQDESVVYEVDTVTVEFHPPVAAITNNTSCSVLLFQTQLKVVNSPGDTVYTIPFRCLKSIEIHQPIFSANYITGVYITQGANTKFTLTFNKGGATEFARVFFRLSEGHLVRDEHVEEEQGTEVSEAVPSAPPAPAPHPTEDKKNR